tara:strand:- start:1901 stop:2761 length:861 start_codon:yes stop_codon:yes gene_type:complete
MKSRSKKNVNLFNKLISNKIVLYIVALIAFIDIIAYIINKEFGAVIFFYLAGLIAYKFSGNMTVVLGSALIATSLVHLLKNMLGFKEGFKKKIVEGKHNGKHKKSKKSKEDNEDNEDNEDSEDVPITTSDAIEEEISSKVNMDQIEEGMTMDNPMKKIEKMKQSMTSVTNPPPPLKSKPNKNKQAPFTNQKLRPAVINNIPNKDKLTQNMSKADNIEAAYDNLEKTIGENNIKSMSGATKDLIAQQNQLVKGLKDVTPVLNEAMGALAKIDLSSLSGMFNKFSANV